jgi:aminoglycoside/choline kinase family phosphotransferase
MEDVRPFCRIARQLLDLGLSAPMVQGVDEEQGLVLLEDLGDRTFTRALAEGVPEAPLYRLAIDTLVALQERFAARGGQPAGNAIPPYDDRRLLDEALLLVDWFLPALRGRESPEEQRRAYRDAWCQVFPIAREVPDTLVLRDYHVDNLMLLNGRDGVMSCGLLDFQDAVIGPMSYDLVSLLEGARRDVSPEIVAASLKRYLSAIPELDRAALEASYAVLGAQRNAKIIGIFTRLCWRDGKPGYLRHIPRVWRLLEAGLAHPALAPVKAWFDGEIPAGERIAPPAGGGEDEGK